MKRGRNKTIGPIPGLALLVLLLLPLGAEVTCAKPEGFEFRPGVLVDLEQSIIYLMNPEGGIDAVRIGSGDLIWRTDRADKPLLVHGELLVAQAEVPDEKKILKLVTLNRADGKVIREIDLGVPEGVEPSIDEGLGTSFMARARAQGDRLMLTWSFTKRHIGGMPPGPDEAKPIEKEGAARIDLATGRVEMMDPEMAVPPAEPPLPEALARLVESKKLPKAPWRVGNVFAWVEHRREGSGRSVVLRRWAADTGKALPEVTLFSDRLTLRYPSADTRHLLASEAKGTKGHEVEYEWSIFSLVSGDRVARILDVRPAAWFFISGSRLVHERQAQNRRQGDAWVPEPLSLRAVDLQTHRELWTHAFRDTKYRGPYPPQPPRGVSDNPPPS